MVSLILIGLIGGVLTSLSPCIIPVLPLVLAVSAGDKRRPYYVVAGMVVSFAAITLSGSIVLNLLGLPQDTVRWVGIGLLVLVGLGMLIPVLGEWVQAPFDRLPRLHALLTKAQGRGGFVVGLALGAVYVPCAGPVLAAITVAAATGEIDASIIALTIAFAIGAAIPLSMFALGGNRMSDWFRSHHTAFRRSAGAVVIAMAVLLAVDAPTVLQRLVPDWTSSAQQALGNHIIGNQDLESCRKGDPGAPHDCGPVPQLSRLENWINTDQSIDPATSGKVTLVDFWAYACINCQRANEHVVKLYDHYKDYGLDVIGVHAPEYAFERDADNVRKAVVAQHIKYPVAQDNSFATWKNFHNRYWPAHYLADHTGRLRQVHEGEGKYAETERVVRQLLQERNPGIALPNPLSRMNTLSLSRDLRKPTWVPPDHNTGFRELRRWDIMRFRASGTSTPWTSRPGVMGRRWSFTTRPVGCNWWPLGGELLRLNAPMVLNKLSISLVMAQWILFVKIMGIQNLSPLRHPQVFICIPLLLAE